jgi:uncharacterized glyoxalase superfamily metalloenzyme YdcJ
MAYEVQATSQLRETDRQTNACIMLTSRKRQANTIGQGKDDALHDVSVTLQTFFLCRQSSASISDLRRKTGRKESMMNDANACYWRYWRKNHQSYGTE